MAEEAGVVAGWRGDSKGEIEEKGLVRYSVKKLGTRIEHQKEIKLTDPATNCRPDRFTARIGVHPSGRIAATTPHPTISALQPATKSTMPCRCSDDALVCFRSMLVDVKMP